MIRKVCLILPMFIISCLVSTDLSKAEETPSSSDAQPPAQPTPQKAEIIAGITDKKFNFSDLSTTSKTDLEGKFKKKGGTPLILVENNYESGKVIAGVHSQDFILIGFLRDNSFITLDDAAFTEVDVYVGEKRDKTTFKKEDTQFVAYGKFFIVRLVNVPSILQAEHGALIQVDVKAGGSVSSFYIMREKDTTLYGLHGFWIPVGLFGTKFAPGDSGIVFASYPVNVAIGGRATFNRRVIGPRAKAAYNYLGFSLMLGWAISRNPKEDKSSFTLRSLNFGLLIDINSYFYTGMSALGDLRKSKRGPGRMYVFGLGPELLKRLAGLK